MIKLERFREIFHFREDIRLHCVRVVADTQISNIVIEYFHENDNNEQSSRNCFNLFIWGWETFQLGPR